MLDDSHRDLPEDFIRCVNFHGHLCPGLAIGYAAVKAAETVLDLTPAEDEEIVAIVENDSCAVDAIQVLLGCTFGKGNLVFRDWGKHVYTFMERKGGRAARVRLKPMERTGRAQRAELRKKIARGDATPDERRLYEDLKKQAALDIIETDSDRLFHVREIEAELPPRARIVETRACDRCGEQTVIDKMIESDGATLCRGCAADRSRSSAAALDKSSPR